MFAHLQPLCCVPARYVNYASVIWISSRKSLDRGIIQSHDWIGTVCLLNCVHIHKFYQSLILVFIPCPELAWCFSCMLSSSQCIQSHECPCSQALIGVCCKAIMLTLEALKRKKAANQDTEVCFKKCTKHVMNLRAVEKKLRHCGQNLNWCCFCLGGYQYLQHPCWECADASPGVAYL